MSIDCGGLQCKRDIESVRLQLLALDDKLHLLSSRERKMLSNPNVCAVNLYRCAETLGVRVELWVAV